MLDDVPDFELRSSGCSLPAGSGVDFEIGLLDVLGSDNDGDSDGGFETAPLGLGKPYKPYKPM